MSSLVRWSEFTKLYDLKDCKCGGSQANGGLGAMYVGAVGRGEWHIYCKRCLHSTYAPKEMDAVALWNAQAEEGDNQ